MCGIIGIAGRRPVASALYDGLLLLQHRGQDSAGIATTHAQSLSAKLHIQKGKGLVRDVFSEAQINALPGTFGIAHVRYPTAGSTDDINEAQPFYVNSPFGLALAHNGNLTNHIQLAQDLFRQEYRHIFTGSDSEVVLNVFARELSQQLTAINAGEVFTVNPEIIFNAVEKLFCRCQGAYAVVTLIAGVGMVAFRDPYGIRPLIIGQCEYQGERETIIASESLTVEALGFELIGEVAAGEAVFIDNNLNVHRKIIKKLAVIHPCIFEYVYFARPDSVMEKVPVAQARYNMGKMLAKTINKLGLANNIDVVMPIPDSGRPAALELAISLGRPYREGFIKNRYIGRTFIMPGQSLRKKSVRHKLNVLRAEFEGKRVALVDDSIVRGTTSKEIIQMARDAGAKEVYFCSASPPVRYQNVYGIDMPTRTELIAHGRKAPEIAEILGCDQVIYQELPDLISAINAENPELTNFETSCFDGRYITGVSEEYLNSIEQEKLNNR